MRLQYKDKAGNVHDYEGQRQAYVDGSIRNDIPIEALAEVLNVQFSIVAQVNPHSLPFFFWAAGSVGRPTLCLTKTPISLYRSLTILR